MKNKQETNNWWLRTSQLKIFSQYVEDNYKREFLNKDGIQNPKIKKDLILQELQDNIETNNKPLEKQLYKFLTQYIDKASKEETDQIWSKIFRYTDLLEKTDFYEYQLSWFNDKLLHLIEFPDEYPLKEVLKNLLENFVFLPYYKNQKQFNTDMKNTLNNLDNFIYKFFDKYPFLVRAIDTHSAWETIQKEKWETEIISKIYVENPIIDKLTYYVYLPGYNNKKLEDFENEVSVTFELSYYPDQLDLREELLKFFDMKNLDMWPNGDYVYGHFPKVDIFVNIWEEWLTWMNSDRWKEYFEVRIYTKPKKIWLENSFYNYLYNSNIYLEKALMEMWKMINMDNIKENIKNEINEYFEWLKNSKDIEETEENFEKETITEILDITSQYLTQKDIEHITNLFDDNKTEEAQKSINLLLDKHFQTKPVKPLLIDFNDGIEKDFENKENSEKKNETQIIKLVKATDLAPKLFLEEATERQIKILEKYLTNREQYEKTLLKAPKWAILYWPPGVGKTETIKYLAQKTWLKIFKVDASDILGMYVWQSEKNISKMFQEYYKVLEKEKAILFIDEADGFFGKRDENNSDKQNGVRSIILQELEWFSTNSNIKNGFIFLWTNFTENIDKAIKERFSFFLKYELPSSEKRKEYLNFLCDYLKTEKWVKIDNIDINLLAKRTDKWSYRALYNLFNNTLMDVAIVKWLNPVVITTDDLIENLKLTKEENKVEEWWNVMGFIS